MMGKLKKPSLPGKPSVGLPVVGKKKDGDGAESAPKPNVNDPDSMKAQSKQAAADFKALGTKDGAKAAAFGDLSDVKKIEVVQDGSKKQKLKGAAATALYDAKVGGKVAKNWARRLAPNEEKNIKALHQYHRDIWRWRHLSCCGRIKASPGMCCRLLCRQPRHLHNFLFHLPMYCGECCCACCPCTGSWVKKYAAEFLGTMLLTMAWSMANTYAGTNWAPLCSGAALMVGVYVAGPISGGHLNPAVTCALCCADRMHTVNCFGWHCQCMPCCCFINYQVWGAIFGGILAGAMMEDSMPTIDINSEYGMQEAWMVEFIYCVLIQSVVLHCAVAMDAQGRQFQGYAQGMARMGAAYAIGPITGAALNPAVMFGVNGLSYFNEFVLFCSAHMTAALLSSGIFLIVRREEYGVSTNLFHKCIAEFLGCLWIMATFGFCEIVQPGSPVKALAVGGVATAVYYMFSYKSGGHFNPLVTIGAYLTGRKVNNKYSFGCYIAAHFLGAIGGSLCYYTTINKVFNLEPGPVGRFETGKWWSVMFAETFFTGFVVFAYISIWMTQHTQKWKVDFGGLVIGNTVFFSMLSTQSVSGGHLNPAISLAGAIASTMDEGKFSHIWPYLFAQGFGTLIGVGLFYAARPEEEPRKEFKEYDYWEDWPPNEIDGVIPGQESGESSNMACETTKMVAWADNEEGKNRKQRDSDVQVKSFSGKRSKVPPSLDVDSINKAISVVPSAMPEPKTPVVEYSESPAARIRNNYREGNNYDGGNVGTKITL